MTSYEERVTPGQLRATRRGDRLSEWRRDQGQVEGDLILLREFDRGTSDFSGDEVLVRVTHVTRHPDHEVPRGWVVMSIRPVDQPVAVRGDVEGSRRRRDAQGAEEL